MNRASPIHYSKIVDVLSKAFNENQSVNYIVKQDSKRNWRIQKLIEYSLRICQAFGDVWVSGDCTACALIYIPDRKRSSIITAWWDIKLVFYAIGITRVVKALKREKQIKTLHPHSSHLHLWFIGVHPNNQNQGKGSMLLTEIIQYYKSEGRPIYLETSVERNLPWYRKFGFEVFQTIKFDYTLYLMKRIT